MTTSTSSHPNQALKAEIRAEALRLGFHACGFADAAAAWPNGEWLADFVADGFHGDMGWMEETLERRRHPTAMWTDARSAVVLGLNYGPEHDPLAALEQPDRAAISVYAQGGDYHDVVKRNLKALARWLVAETPSDHPMDLKVFVDTAPVMEKPLAAAAGLGWQGKHTNLVSRTEGSWLFLGAIYTTLELAAFGGEEAHERDRCGSCDACQRACPTDAFPAPYRLDARRCISYLTIEHAGPIPLEFRESIGNRIYGCDDCLAVCPWNKFAEAAHANRAFRPRAELASPALADLLALDDAAFRQVFSGSPIKRIGRDRMMRNCLIAAGNSGDTALRAPVARLLDDPNAVVAEAAGWALARLA